MKYGIDELKDKVADIGVKAGIPEASEKELARAEEMVK